MAKTINLKKFTKDQLIRMYDTAENNLINERRLRADLQDRYTDMIKQNKQLTNEVANNDEAVQTMSIIIDAILAEVTNMYGTEEGVVKKLRLPMPKVLEAPKKWEVRTEADRENDQYVVTIREKVQDEK